MASDINSKKNGTGSALEKALAVLEAIVEQPQSVGVPVLGPDGASPAALGMHGPTTRVSLDRAPEIAVKLQTAAKRLAEFWDMSD